MKEPAGIVLIAPELESARVCVRESKSVAEASGAAHTRVSIVPGSESEYAAGVRTAAITLKEINRQKQKKTLIFTALLLIC